MSLRWAPQGRCGLLIGGLRVDGHAVLEHEGGEEEGGRVGEEQHGAVPETRLTILGRSRGWEMAEGPAFVVDAGGVGDGALEAVRPVQAHEEEHEDVAQLEACQPGDDQRLGLEAVDGMGTGVEGTQELDKGGQAGVVTGDLAGVELQEYASKSIQPRR